jgi:hypothetical protein
MLIFFFMRIRRDDRLSNLVAASRAKLDGWLKVHTYREVVQLAAAAPPVGLRLKTNIRALSVYYRKYIAPNPLQTLFHLAKSDPVAAQSAATAMLHAQTLHAASSPDFNIHTYNALARFHFRNTRARLDQRRQALDQLKLAVHAAPAQNGSRSP